MRAVMRTIACATAICLAAACFGPLVGCGDSSGTTSPGSAPSATQPPANGSNPSGPSDPGSSSSPADSASDSDAGTTSGPAFSEPATVLTSPFDEAAAETFADGALAIDSSHLAEGYVGARATASSRCKFQVICGEMSYNYDLPEDGSPIVVPLNMGDGSYTFRIMQNTSGTNYVELAGITADVALENQFIPFERPNLFCNYSSDSPSVEKARQLASSCANEGDVVRAVYDWMTAAISYDNAKAEQLATTTGYVPNPDDTLASGTGICFDYASLAAAMFRSLGVPCQIITGYVSPNDIYHAWNMIYINGEWISAHITVEQNRWCRVDLTFAATALQNGGSTATVGDGTSYTDRYVY